MFNLGNALDLANILTVKDFLKTPPRKLQKLRGVGHKTRREILAVAKVLKEQLGSPTLSDDGSDTGESDLAAQEASGSLSVDRLVQQIAKPSSKDGKSAQLTINALLGLDPDFGNLWPSQTDITGYIDLSRGRIGQLVGKLQKRWAKMPAVTRLRNDLIEILKQTGGVMTAEEVALALLIARGSLTATPQLRTQQAKALVRAALEVERTMVSPRFILQRSGHSI